jgi:hypothetical protein
VQELPLRHSASTTYTLAGGGQKKNTCKSFSCRFLAGNLAFMDKIVKGQNLPILRIYNCPKCKYSMRKHDAEVWGKIVRCPECAEVVADNLEMPPPLGQEPKNF